MILAFFEALFSWPFHIGLAIFPLVLIWIPLVFLVRFVLRRKLTLEEPKRSKVIRRVFWIMLLIPTADIFLSSFQYNYVCNAFAGVHIYKTVEGVGGFLTDNERVAEEMLESGFDFMEYEISSSLYRWTAEDYQELKEKYGASDALNYSKLPYEVTDGSIWSTYEYTVKKSLIGPFVMKGQKAVRNRNTGEVLAERVSYRFIGGWVDQLFLGRNGFMGCSGDADKYGWLFFKDAIKK